VEAKAADIKRSLGAGQLHQSAPVTAAYAAITGQVAVVVTLNTQIKELGAVVAQHFGRHPDAEITTLAHPLRDSGGHRTQRLRSRSTRPAKCRARG
jgi:hypothetical protein